MAFKSPLTQRIIFSFVLLTAVVSGLFSFGIMAAIDIIEEDLVSAELNRKFPSIVDEYEKGYSPKLDLDTQFYSGNEKELGDFNPSQKDYLEQVFTNEEVQIYEVK